MTTAVRILVGLLGFGVLIGAGAGARAAEPPSPPTIGVSADATVAVEPDRAEIEIGVVTEAKAAQAAVTQNAQKLDATLNKLRALLGPNAKLQTTRYALTPIHSVPRDRPPIITGYAASNSVRVILDDLKAVGRVIDAATEGGANTIDRLEFTLKDDRDAYNQALAQAAADARAEAETIAAALGLKIVRVLRVEEFSHEVRPVMLRQSRAAFAEQAQTPIEAGPLDIRAGVTLTVEVAP